MNNFPEPASRLQDRLKTDLRRRVRNSLSANQHITISITFYPILKCRQSWRLGVENKEMSHVSIILYFGSAYAGEKSASRSGSYTLAQISTKAAE